MSKPRGAMPKTTLRVDAHNAVKTFNNNPHTYSVTLPRPLRNVSCIELKTLTMSQTPLFLVLVVSDWTAGPTTDFHQLAQRMATAINNTPDTSSYTATITNPDMTCLLHVHDVITRTQGRQSDSDVKTYDAMLCTGTVQTNTMTDWTITAQGETPNTAITPTPDNSTLSVQVVNQTAILRIKPDGNAHTGRMSEPQALGNDWESFQLYYPGDIVTTSGSTMFVCNTKHLSVVFADDLSAGMWSQYAQYQPYQSQNNPTNAAYSNSTYSPYNAPVSFPSPADASFAVFDFASQQQSREVLRFEQGELLWQVDADRVGAVTFSWHSSRRFPGAAEYVFPYDPAQRVTNVDAGTYTMERNYAAPVMQLEFTHSS